MKFKIGNDIIETSRIQKLCEIYKDKFKKRVFTENEIKYCESKGKNKYQSYAARFCAKEAVFKAISDGLSNKYEIKWTDIEILNNKNGKPIVKINNSKTPIIVNILACLSFFIKLKNLVRFRFIS